MSERVLFIEPVGGIAGDMFLGAAIDLGVSVEALQATLKTLSLPGWELKVTKAERHGLFGTRVEVLAPEPADGHPHRHLADIEALIRGSQLSARAQETALRIFRLIGEVEAKIHGTTIEHIHFHEVGAVDSIVDICGAAVALDMLGNPKVFALPPPVGSGNIRIAHGVVPVPVPATLALLQGVPIRFEGVGELTTPTGAAILKALAHFGAPREMVVERIGYGVGTKDWADRANVVRLSEGTIQNATEAAGLMVFECNLDDCSPQLLGLVIDNALQVGAVDAWITPVLMKKGRPGQVVSVLAESRYRAQVTEVLFRHTTTLGVREYSVARSMLGRRFETVSTPWGTVQMKLGLLGEQVVNAAPEFDDCRRVAEQAGVPVKEVQSAALAQWFKARSA